MLLTYSLTSGCAKIHQVVSLDINYHVDVLGCHGNQLLFFSLHTEVVVHLLQIGFY